MFHPSVQRCLLTGCLACLPGLAVTPTMAREQTAGELAISQALGRRCQVVSLWPEPEAIPDVSPTNGSEEARRPEDGSSDLTIHNVARPSLVICAPAGKPAQRPAMVLCPGGRYGHLAMEESIAAAQWLNGCGITAVVLKYRVPKRNQGLLMYHNALQDLQRAVGLLRSQAGQWDIDPGKIGVCGDGTGAHLAAMHATHFLRLYEAVDEQDRVSCRPDVCLLLDPAYLTDPLRSRNLVPPLRAEKLSPAVTPPTWIGCSQRAPAVWGAVLYAMSLRQAEVPFALHVDSGHGMRRTDAGTGTPDGAEPRRRGPAIERWTTSLRQWLGDVGLLPPPPQPAPLTYLAATLPEVDPTGSQTLGDARLRQIVGHDAPLIPLWPPGQAPDETLTAASEKVTHRSRGGQALNITNVTRPTLTLVKTDDLPSSCPAVIVCPGGGYGGLAAEHEGTRVAEWFNTQGYAAFVLKYRVPRRGGKFAKHHHALQDLQRAMRIVRSSAAELDIDPHRIGVCGFSAGGHLCATLATNFQEPAYEPLDAVDQNSPRPDFGLLIYPAYLTDPVDSDRVDAVARGMLKSEVTPPLFMAIAADDRFARGMLNYYLEVREANVPSECHVYAGGGHGGGLDPVSYPTSQWTQAAERWLKSLQD